MEKTKEEIKERIKQLMKVDKGRSWKEVGEDWKELVELSEDIMSKLS